MLFPLFQEIGLQFVPRQEIRHQRFFLGVGLPFFGGIDLLEHALIESRSVFAHARRADNGTLHVVDEVLAQFLEGL